MWLHTIVLTFIFFLISFGFGLLILAISSISLIEESRMSKLQLIALAIAMGGPGTGIFLQLLSLASANIRVDLGALLLASTSGLAATRNVWFPRREDRDDIALWIALSLPLALMTWYWSFGAFSAFPFGDVGANVHWMKIAQEYADTGIINPYANQSYTDLRVALAGALAGTFGLDLLQFDWVYRYFSILYFMIVFFAVADSLFLDPYRKLFAFFFAAASNTVGLLTNGSAAVAGSLIFLTVLLKIDLKPKPQRIFSTQILLLVSGAAAGILLAFFLNNNAFMLASLLAISLILNILNRTGSTGKNIATRLFSVTVWASTLMFIHRGSYLFVPIAISGWLFYLIVSRIFSRAQLVPIGFLWSLALLLPVLCLCITAGIAAAHFGYLPSISADKLFSHVTLLLFGRAIENGDEITLGAGPIIAAIELGRAIGPLFAAGIGAIFLWWWRTHWPARLQQMAGFPTMNENAKRLLWSWIMGCGLCLVVLTGFPFLYRIIFVITGFFTIATTELFFQLLVDPVPDVFRRRRFVAVSAGSALVVLAIVLYALSRSSDLRYSGYEAILRPMEIAAIALALFAAALTFARSRRLQVCGLATATAFAVAIDRSEISTLSMVYSYGRLPNQVTVVSHYNASDLAAARWLHNNMRNAIVVSDPYTLGMAKAIAGTPGIYLFSNLDTVNETTAAPAKRVLSAIAEPADDGRNGALKACASLAPMLANLNQEALVQIQKTDLLRGILKRVRPAEIKPGNSEDAAEAKEAYKTPEDILRATDILRGAQDKDKWNVVAIINARTIQWLHVSGGQRLSYFPTSEPLHPKTLKALDNGAFPVVFSDDHSTIILIDCAEAMTRSNIRAF
jgi:hypothetical protein